MTVNMRMSVIVVMTVFVTMPGQHQLTNLGVNMFMMTVLVVMLLVMMMTAIEQRLCATVEQQRAHRDDGKS